ncbi:MAG: acyl-CoA thioesterase domain-containing protein, partial [Pseudomonadota bacterium]
MSFVLDDATRLTRRGERSYTANADPRFLNVRGMFGGWVAALTCAGVEVDEQYRGTIISHTVNFHQAVDLEEVSVQVTLVDQRRRLDFWEVDLLSQSGQSLAHAMVVSGLRSPTEMTFETEAPERRAAEDCIALPRSPQAPAWFSHYDMRLAKGRPFQRNDAPASTTYIR